MHLGMEECPVTFRVTVTLTSDLVFRICIESYAYHPFFLCRNPKFGEWIHLWIAVCRVPFWVAIQRILSV